MRRQSAAIILGALLVAAPAAAESPPSLLTAVDAGAASMAEAQAPAGRPVTKRQKFTGIRFEFLPAPSRAPQAAEPGTEAPIAPAFSAPYPRLELELFDGESIVFVVDEVRDESPDGSTVSLVGHAEGVEGSAVTIVSSGDAVAGNITLPGGVFYQIRQGTAGLHLLREIDQSRYGSEIEPGDHALPDGIVPEAPPEFLPALPAPEGGDQAAYDESGTVIDVMVVYTPATRTANGGTAGTNTLIDLGVTETNTGYSNSGLTQRVNLVYRGEVAYTETTAPDSESTIVFDDALAALQGTSDGEMDGVHGLRNDYGADIVSLFVNDPTTGWCGLGNVMYTESHNFASSAFNVVDWDCATGYYSFSHEMGHNQGAMHDRHTTGSNGVFSYSHGYQDPERSFRTVMAYNCPNGGCTRVNWWSNPDIDYVVGVNNYGPMGIVYTAANSADNRRSHNLTRDTVANWRPRFIYVDAAYGGSENGLSATPFNTVGEGVGAIGRYATGARLYVQPGTYAGAGNVPILISKPITIYKWGTEPGSVLLQ